MSTAGWMTRVCAWFGRKADAPGDLAPEASWSGGGQLALVGTAVAEEEPPAHPAPVQSPDPFAAAPPAQRGPLAAALRTSTHEPAPNLLAVHAPPRPRIDPLDPPWMKDLAALETLGRELQGHRDATQDLLRTVRQLPELTSDQTDHIVQTNRLLERHGTLLGAILDSLTGLGASMQSMAESSRRNLLAIGQLETSHRQVLAQYQRLLLDSHRRLGRLAALATILSAIALGGVAVAVYLAIAGI